MDPVRNNVDFSFFAKAPFGIMMTTQTLFSFMSLVLFHFIPFQFEGSSWAIFFLWILFTGSLFHNLIHLFGINRRVFVIGNQSVFFPAALCVFIVAGICSGGMSVSLLIIFVGFIDSLSFTYDLMLFYAILTIKAAALTYVCMKIVILLLRAAPNGQVMALSKIIIQGDKTERIGMPATVASETTTTTTANV